MQGFKEERLRLGDFTYRVTQLDAITGQREFTRLWKLIGPAASKWGAEGIVAACRDFLPRIAADDIKYYCALFAKGTTVESGGNVAKLSDIFGVHFAGRYGALVDWLVFAFDVNFKGFFRRRERPAGSGGVGVRIELEPEVWWVWRLLSSPRIRLTLTELERMSIDDALEAHYVIDALEAAEQLAHQQAEQQAEARVSERRQGR